MPWDRTRSPVGWYLVSVLERLEPIGARKDRRALAWENWHLVRAESAAEAYDKGRKIGQCQAGTEAIDEHDRKCRWRFVGVSDLVPIYETLEDGAEILWINHGTITAAKAKRNVWTKRQILAAMKRGQVGAPARPKADNRTQPKIHPGSKASPGPIQRESSPRKRPRARGDSVRGSDVDGKSIRARR